jgi:hypothetical protein
MTDGMSSTPELNKTIKKITNKTKNENGKLS